MDGKKQWVIRQEARRDDLWTPADEVSVMELAANHRTATTLWVWRAGGYGGGGVVAVDQEEEEKEEE